MEGGTGRGCSIYACLALSQDFRRCELAPNAAAKGPPGLPPKSGACSYLSAHTALTRLPAALAAPLVGGNLILGGPSLLQALWAVAVPIGICTQER